MSRSTHKTAAAKAHVPATTDTKAVVPAGDFGAYAGMGLENLGKDEISIPFLGIVQKMSKVTDENPLARGGMLYNTVTKELYDAELPAEGVVFLPVDRAKKYNEWVPIKQGGGFKGQHDPEEAFVKEQLAKGPTDPNKPGVYKLSNGNELIETFYIFGMLVAGEERQMVVISFTSTNVKAYKNWMTRASTLRHNGAAVPLFGARYRLHTVKKSNDQGIWWVFDAQLDGANFLEAAVFATDPLFLQAVDYIQMIRSGAAKPAVESLDADIPEGEGTAL